jgi:hypothetical protein
MAISKRSRRACSVAVLLAVVSACHCYGQDGLSERAKAQAARGAASETDSLRTFMRAVANDVTKDGPDAWLKYFDESPAFFMAVNGAMAFPNSAAAQEGTRKFAETNRRIELHWGEDLRVDPLAPGLAVVAASWHEVQIDNAGHRVEEGGYFTGVAEKRDGRWLFRDTHWSQPAAPAAAN